jgi:hypothetical protein
MRTRNAYMSLLGCAAILLFTSTQCAACWCSTPARGGTELDWVTYYSTKGPADTIFEASIAKQNLLNGTMGAPNAISMTGSGHHRLVSLRVLRVYRGHISGQATVATGFGNGDCGFNFETGKQYLIYAKRAAPDSLYTDICFGTTPLDEADAGPALRLLRGEPPAREDLLDRGTYYRQVLSPQLGTVCGRVTTESGRPLRGVCIEMTQVRDDPFPPETADDPDCSKADGSFCVRGIPPGKYILTGEETDFDHDFRLMGYYPGVTQPDRATVLQIGPSVRLDHMNFVIRKQPLYTVSFTIVASDGSHLPLDNIGITLDSPQRDSLSYHEDQHLRDGEYTLGYVPPGKYTVKTIPWGQLSPSVAAELARWRMANQQVEINSDADIVLKLERASAPRR